MPRKYKPIKKATRYHRRNKIRKSMVTNVSFPLGKSQTARLRYSEQIQLNPTAGTGAKDYVFRANDLYDPNYSAIGHQPYGFDQMMQFFDHFTVIASKIRVTFVQNSVSKVPLQVGIKLDDNNVSMDGTTMTVLMEQPESKFKIVTYENHAVVTKGFSAKKFFHKKAIVGDASYRGSVAASPTDDAWYHVLVAPYIDAEEADVTTMRVEIEYIAVFTEPKTLTSS